MMPPFAITPTSDATNPAFCANARVLTALRGYGFKTGRAFPKVETIAEETGLSVRTVQRAIRQLAAAKLIKIEPGGKHRSSNVYVIVGHSGVTTLSPQSEVWGDNPVTSGVTDLTLGVTQRVTHEETHLRDSIKKEDARERAAPDGRARRLLPEGMTKGQEALLKAQLRYYDMTGEWDPSWEPLPPLLDEGGVVMDVEEDEDVEAEPVPELLRETGS
jgi:Helix-turn-helix domain